MKTILGKNLGCIMSKWKLLAAGFIKYFPDQIINTSQFSGWRRGKYLPTIEFILRLSDITGLSAQTLCRKIISESDLPIQPILNKEYEQGDKKINLINEPLSKYLGIEEILKRLDQIEDKLGIKK